MSGDRAKEAKAFIEAVIALGQDRGFTIQHEDGHGAFIVRDRQIDKDRGQRADLWLASYILEVAP